MPLNAEAPPTVAADRLKKPARNARIMIVAGEASGDLHGGDLAREILARDPSCELFGIAGEKMRAAGVRAIVEMEQIHGLGLSELTSTIGRTIGAFRALRRIIRREKPALVILIDYAEFNLILSGTARRNGVPVLYYITPQVWAWRRGRIDKLVDRADRLAVVLPFEAELFHRAGDRVSFVGHPLLDRIAVDHSRDETLKRHGFAPRARIISILPGSRRAEVRYLLEPMINAARIVARDHNLEIALALAPTLTQAELAEVGRADLTESRSSRATPTTSSRRASSRWSRRGPRRWRLRCSDAPRSSLTKCRRLPIF